ncbi:MAG: LPXTG cell wall anchor domain-containing protein [Ruminococcus sp.]|nr:LPXTG cell wall anchor domain-containing protein [Ruminococcus sp.]
MKNFKRFTAAIAATLMAATLSVPMAMTASAADETYRITVGEGAYTGYTGDTAAHTYEAYQIFTGTVVKDENGTPTGKLEGISWGSAIDETKVYGKLAEITIGTGAEAKTPFKKDGANMTSAPEVAAALSTGDDSELAKKFADAVAASLKADALAIVISGEANFAGGYYLIQDKSGSPAGTNAGAKTRYILKVVGDATFQPKSGVPSVEKKVRENVKTSVDKFVMGAYEATDNKLNDVADYCIGDTVPFELIGTLPGAYDDYTSYFYQFNDTLGEQFNTPTDIKVYAVNATGETEITENFTVTNPIANNFTVTCNDLKKVTGVTKDTVIVVRYNAVLNSKAVVGLNGQENKVDLTYSRNPNYKGEGSETPDDDKGKTPEEKVIIFTYELDVTKYLDTEAKTAAANQAGFKLSRTIDGKTTYATLVDNKITGWVDAEASATEVKTAADGKFSFIGLDDGTYVLKETTTPVGYNTMEELTLVIDATTVNNQAWNGTPDTALTELKLWHGTKGTGDATPIDTAAKTGDNANGIVSDKIINKSGSTLPSTGGIGTTLFYLAGGAMVAVAGIFLITKKRMNKDAE